MIITSSMHTASIAHKKGKLKQSSPITFMFINGLSQHARWHVFFSSVTHLVTITESMKIAECHHGYGYQGRRSFDN